MKSYSFYPGIWLLSLNIMSSSFYVFKRLCYSMCQNFILLYSWIIFNVSFLNTGFLPLRKNRVFRGIYEAMHLTEGFILKKDTRAGGEVVPRSLGWGKKMPSYWIHAFLPRTSPPHRELTTFDLSELGRLGRMTRQRVKYMEKDDSESILIFAYTLKE